MESILKRSMSSRSLEASREVGEQTAKLPIWKRSLDLGVILLFSPVLVLVGTGIALLIKLGSSGPVLFRQRRVGYKGQEFLCYKFRSMKVDAKTDSHRGHTERLMKSETPMTKLDAEKDPRIIPFGSLLRCTGLDELPQLINVFRGEMSLVGPRPCIPYECAGYETWQRRRFDAVPGLTGLWQVSGKNRTTFNQMIHLDIKYSQRANLWLDLKIILKTVPALIIQCYDTWVANSKPKATKSKSAPGALAENVRSLHL